MTDYITRSSLGMATSATTDLPYPAGCVADDTVVVVVGARAVTPNELTSLGFTTFITGGGAQTGFKAYWKKYLGTEPVNIVLSIPTHSGAGAFAYRYSKDDVTDPTITPPQGGSAFLDVNDINPDPPNFAPTGGSKDYAFLAGYFARDSATPSVTPTDYLNVANAGAGSGMMSTCTRALTAASDDPSAYTTSNNDWTAFTIAVHPAGASGPSAAITGTITTAVESDIVLGGETIDITVTGDTWIAAGTGPIGTIAQSDAILASIDSAQAEAGGWDAQVKANFVTTDLARISDTLARVTLQAEAGYVITADENITVGDIANAVLTTSATDVTPTPAPAFTITNETPALSFDFSGAANIFKNNTVTALINRTAVVADVYLASTGDRVGLRKTGLTTDGIGNLDDISDVLYTSAEHDIIVKFAEGEKSLIRSKTPS